MAHVPINSYSSDLGAIVSIFPCCLLFAPGLNEELVQLLLIRDELHTEQDAMLVDIEDLTRSVRFHPFQRSPGWSEVSESGQERGLENYLPPSPNPCCCLLFRWRRSGPDCSLQNALPLTTSPPPPGEGWSGH